MFAAEPWAVLHLRENEFLYHHSHTAQEQALHSLLLGAVIHSVRVAFFIVALHCRSTLVEYAGLLQLPITHFLLGDSFFFFFFTFSREPKADKKCAVCFEGENQPFLQPQSAEQDVDTRIAEQDSPPLFTATRAENSACHLFEGGWRLFL